MVQIRQKLKNLSSLVALLGVTPIYLYLDLPTQIVIVAALVAGLWSDRKEHYLLSSSGATFLVFAVFIIYLLQIDLQNLVLPVLNMIVLLLAVRLLTAKQGRHFLQIFILAGFALAGSTLLTLHLSFLPLMILMVGGLIHGLVLLCFDASDPKMTLNRVGYRTLFKTTLLLPAGSLLLAILFFFILPRTQYPLWDFLNPGSLGTVGFSEEVRPGSLSETVTDQSIAFRAASREWKAEDLYWRVTVLNRLDGNVWKREAVSAPGISQPKGGSDAELTIFPVDGEKKFLVTLDAPYSLSGVRFTVSRDNVFTLNRPTKRLRSYQVFSRIGGEVAAEPGLDEQLYLVLPEGIAPQARAAIRAELTMAKSRSERVAIVKDFFRRQELVYATQGLPTTGDPVDTFLFSSKRGYCEHFSSAFAVLLREAKVPTRLVGGYLGGDYNPIAGYYVVGERAAHVWVEYLDANSNWQRYDPNLLAIRMESGLLATRGQRPPGWRQLIDTVDYFWTQAVVTLDFERQLKVASALWRQWQGADRERLALRAATAAGAVLLLLIGWLIWRRNRRRRTPHNRLVKRFLQRVLAVSGEELTPGGGLMELAERSGSPAAQEFARLYGAALYRDRHLTAEELVTLKRLLKQIDRQL